MTRAGASAGSPASRPGLSPTTSGVDACELTLRVRLAATAVAAGASATGGTGVSGTFGTLTRPDGTIQVTSNGLPLYGWQGDAKPGDVTGQGVEGFSIARP